MPTKPERILILRISALGDIVFATSLLEGLRRAYPDAHIAWLTQPGLGRILADDPRLNELIELAPGALDNMSAVNATRKQLRALPRFDWVIDAQGLLKTRSLARMIKADQRFGFQSKEPGGFMMSQVFAKGGKQELIASEYRFFSEALTGQSDPGPPTLHPQSRASEKAGQLMREQGLEPGFVALCPFTTRPQKHWIESNWPKLATRLEAGGVNQFAILGGPDDQDSAARMQKDMPAGCVDLSGKTGLAELPALVAKSSMLIGVDTGLTHIGSAVRRPVVALFGSTRPYLSGTESPLNVLFQDMACAPCKRNPICNGAFTCMRELTPDEVANAALKMLEAQSEVGA